MLFSMHLNYPGQDLWGKSGGLLSKKLTPCALGFTLSKAPLPEAAMQQWWLTIALMLSCSELLDPTHKCSADQQCSPPAKQQRCKLQVPSMLHSNTAPPALFRATVQKV